MITPNTPDKGPPRDAQIQGITRPAITSNHRGIQTVYASRSSPAGLNNLFPDKRHRYCRKQKDERYRLLFHRLYSGDL